MIFVLTTEQPEGVTGIYFTNNGNFAVRSPGLSVENRTAIYAWCVGQWGHPSQANGWESYMPEGYIYVRTSAPEAGMSAKLRWHGLANL